MDCLKLVALCDNNSIEADKRAALAEELGHKKVEAATIEVDRVVNDAQVFELRELEYLYSLLHWLDLVLAEIEVSKFG